MDRDDCVLFVNSTPAYYYILPLFFKLLRRYAPELNWPVVLVTEVPEHPICQQVVKESSVAILTIPPEAKGFLESRLAALNILKKSFKYCFPLQEDFLLEMPMNAAAFAALLKGLDLDLDLDLDSSVASARCMPCPGPHAKDVSHPKFPGWKMLSPTTDQYGFTFQATIWRTAAAAEYYERICAKLDSLCPKEAGPAKRHLVELTANLAENTIGQTEFWAWSAEKNYEHIAFERAGSQPNAVYLCPFPYRPTAIVKGVFESWAQDLAKREGIPTRP